MGFCNYLMFCGIYLTLYITYVYIISKFDISMHLAIMYFIRLCYILSIEVFPENNLSVFIYNKWSDL